MVTRVAKAMIERARRERLVDPDRMIVLSLKPLYAEAILSGAKTVELRRIGPKISVRTRALIYAFCACHQYGGRRP